MKSQRLMPSSSAPFARVARQDSGVVTLTIHHPETRNALSEANIEALDRALRDLAADPSVRVLILAAEGPTYCAGHDLKEITQKAQEDNDGGRAYNQRLIAACSAMMLRLVRFPSPTIARIHAPATAAGSQLVASCDLAYASDTAWFATPGVNLGLFCSTPMAPISRVVSGRHAMEMLLTGQPVSAARAVEIGLINQAYPAEALEAKVDALAAVIASKSARVVRNGKALFRRQRSLNLEDAYEMVGDFMARDMEAPNAKEGITAFLERRDPKWVD